MTLSQSLASPAQPAKLALPGYALLLLLGFGTGPLFAQAAPPAPQGQTGPVPGAFAARVAEIERGLVEKEPRLKRLPPAKRKALIEFVIGNVLFVSTHEFGHGVLAEFELPNLGHDEDAADNFAILTALKVGNNFSDRVLTEAAKGWYLADLRDKATGEKPEYYDAHGMNLQRGYQIICMMVGSNPEKFRELADIAKMPEDRQRSCKTDFTFMSLSWETLLKPHLRAPDQPKQKIDITYGDAKGPLAVYAKAFRDMKFLETLAEAIGDRFAWPQPFSMEMVECGEVGANWRSRKLKICYEMAQEFAELYRDYGAKLKPAKPQANKKKKTS
jgi:Putative metallopeptidase